MFRPVLFNTVSRNRSILTNAVMRRKLHHEEDTKPFDTLPFRVTNRYVYTLAHALILGVGFWSPFFILWYSMAKRTM